MHRQLSLKKNFVWTFLGSIAASACQWLMLIAMAKMLSQEEVGYYALAMAIVAPIVMFSMLQLRAVQVTDVHGQYTFGDYFGVRLLTNGLAFLVIICISFFLLGRYGPYVFWVILAEGVTKLIEATSDIAYGLIQKHERMDKMAQSLIVRNVGGLIFLSLVIFVTRNLLWGIVALGIWWLAVFLFFDCRNAAVFEKIFPCFDLKRAAAIIWLSLPLGVVMGLLSLNQSIPRFFVEFHLGAGNLGVFSAMAYVVVGASRFVIALGQTVSPRLAKYFAFNRTAYVYLLTRVVLIALLMAVAAVLFGIFWGQDFLRIVYTPDYAQQPDVFVWLLVVGGAQMVVSMLGVGMTAARKFRSQVGIQTAAVLVCLLACWILVPLFGLKGAAFAMLATQIVVAVIGLFVIVSALHSPVVPPAGFSENLTDRS